MNIFEDISHLDQTLINLGLGDSFLHAEALNSYMVF
jgi:hypothetical protein